MLHKKQPYLQLEQTIAWNKVRNNNNLDWDLEIAMLQEELNELKSASTDVDRFDALLDLKFVLTGSLGKMNLSPTNIVDGYQAVLDANQQKLATLDTSGKVTKPTDFINPEPRLQGILNTRT